MFFSQKSHVAFCETRKVKEVIFGNFLKYSKRWEIEEDANGSGYRFEGNKG